MASRQSSFNSSMSKILDHPVVATTTVMGTIFGIASSLAAFGQISVNLAIGAGVLLLVAVIGAFLYVEWNWEPEPIAETINEPVKPADLHPIS